MEQKKSRLLRMTLKGGEARVFLCDTTQMAQQARDIHHASNTCTAAMGRMLAAAAIMGVGLKSEGDRITVTINGGGPAGTLCAVAGPDGTVKVTIENPEVELPLKPNGKLDVGGALGKDGQLTIMRSFGYGEPYVGRVALVSGEIAEDFAMYYLESEQTPSLCALGTLVGEQVLSAGGILIQAMPGCSDELLDALEVRAELFGSISQLLEEMTLEDLAYACFRDLEPEVLEEIPLTLHCDCSREYIERVLLSMGEKEIEDLIRTQNGCEVTCHFCRSSYAFTGDELRMLLAQAQTNGDA
ncbi:MAG: Hsp33 family molecular chaperone HslO [Christensenellales bacterium]|nr:Hsp33 family molecular chaperone HslO [Christensenellales bacterium]